MGRSCAVLSLLALAIMGMVSPVQAQWWGSDSLPSNSSAYTYRTRLGFWQFGGELRNLATSPRFDDRGIIRSWEGGMPIAVDRNIPGGRFAQQGVPSLVYIPRIDYCDDLGRLTDVRYREGLRQYWPEDQQILSHEWEQIAHEPDRTPPTNAVTSTQPTQSGVDRSETFVLVTQAQNRHSNVQPIVIKQVTPKNKQPKLTYHQHIMQAHAERRAAEKERQDHLSQQRFEQQSGLIRDNRYDSPYVQYQKNEQLGQFANQRQYTQSQQALANSEWFRDGRPDQSIAMRQSEASTTYIVPKNPSLEIEKRLEYSLVQSPNISFYSAFRAKFESGTVIISGIVGSEQERQAAERVLMSHPEVQQVQNNLTIVQ